MNGQQNQKSQQIQIKFPDDILKGVYANFMNVITTREEFVLDFANVFPPAGIMTARVIISPGHMKRIIRVLESALKNYENKFGKTEEAEEPKAKIGFQPSKN